MSDFYYVKRKGTDKKFLLNLDKVVCFFECDDDTVIAVLDNGQNSPIELPFEGTLSTVSMILGEKAK